MTPEAVRPIYGAVDESGGKDLQEEEEDADVLDEGAVRGPRHMAHQRHQDPYSGRGRAA